MTWRDGIRKGRSHLVFAFVLAVSGLVVINITDDTLEHGTSGKLNSSSSPARSTVTSGAPAPPVSKPPAFRVAPTSDRNHAYVQIGSYQNEVRAASEGRQVLRDLEEPAGLGVRIEAFRSLYRLQIGPIAEQDAAPLCQRLVTQGRDCLLVQRAQKTFSTRGN